MKPIDYYTAEPIFVSTDIWSLESIIEEYIQDLDEINLGDSKNITLKYYVKEVYDGGEKSFEVFSAWLDEKAVMLVLKDDDIDELIVTSEEGFKNIINYIESLRPEKEVEEDNIPLYAEDDEINILNEFNNRTIRHYYVKETVNPMFSEGDIVLAEVLEDHLRDRWNQNPVMINERCVIIQVHKHDPYKTYSMRQLDRKIAKNREGIYTIIKDTGNGTIFAAGNDHSIKELLGADISHIFNTK